MSEMRALTNLVGNGVATIVVAKWEDESMPDRCKGCWTAVRDDLC